MGRVSGKVALVTGAGSGLGRADAIALVREGARVVITDINEAAGRELEQSLNASAPGSAFFMTQDVSSESRWQEVFAETEKRFGGLHVLVNNAATNPYFGATLGVDTARYDKTFQVNLAGPLFWTKAVWEAGMHERPGVVVNIAPLQVAGVLRTAGGPG